jgi:Peptidase family M23
MKPLVALLPVLIAFQAGAPPALAWTWPADGPVLRPFVLGDDPYAAAQHRGVDIAAPPGALVRAPASGAVSFAGTVPDGGRTVTIRTADGYSITLVHLGSIGVQRGQVLAEGAGVGSAGRSGEAEHPEPYVHLGVRVSADPQGYVDPLGLLPPRGAPPPMPPVPPAEQVPDAPPEPPPAPEAPEAPAPAAQAPAPTPELPAPAPAAPAPLREPSVERLPVPVATAPEPAPAARPVPSEAGRGQDGHVQTAPRIGRTLERGFELPPILTLDTSREHAPTPAAPDGRSRGPAGMLAGAALAAVGLAVAGRLALRRRRRDLLGARSADAAPAVLRDGAGRATEDAPVSRTAEENGLVADGDLERVPLGQPKPLPDLDWDDDPPELVQVPDDPCCRLPASATRHGFHRVPSRPPRHRRRPARSAARSFR